MATAEKKPIMTGTSSGHITNLKQSILETFDIYGKTGGAATHPSGNSSKRQLIEVATHRSGNSSKWQLTKYPSEVPFTE
jgi:hypothetical protein